MPTAADNIDTAIANLTELMALKTAEWIAAGMPPDFTLDGLSVNWAAWIKQMNDNLKAMLELRQLIQGPFIAHQRLRS